MSGGALRAGRRILRDLTGLPGLCSPCRLLEAIWVQSAVWATSELCGPAGAIGMAFKREAGLARVVLLNGWELARIRSSSEAATQEVAAIVLHEEAHHALQSTNQLRTEARLPRRSTRAVRSFLKPAPLPRFVSTGSRP